MLISYKEIKPSPPLDQLVKCFWVLEKFYAHTHAVETVYPDGCLDLVFSLSEGRQKSFLIGQQNQRIDIPQRGKVRSFGIRFFPYGAYPFLNVPISEFTNQTIDLSDIDKDLVSLSERIFSITTQEAVIIIEQALLQRLFKINKDISQVKTAARFLYEQFGQIRVDHLADHVNMSKRTLERRLEDFTGLSPKALAKIFRFNKIRNELTHHPGKNLTELSYQFNYYDQSHFIRDFKQITEMSPSEFADEVNKQKIAFYKK